VTPQKSLPEPKEYEVEIRKTSYGSVKVRARSKEQAEKVVRDMHRKRLMHFWKEKFTFLHFGEVTENDRNSILPTDQ